MIPFDEYRKIEAANWSSISAIATSPRLYKWRQDHPREDTPALSLGRAVHTAVLEPDEFEERYVIKPKGLDGRTKYGKWWLAEAKSNEVEVLTEQQGETIARIVESIAQHDVARELIAATSHEVTLQWVDEETGVSCKGRADGIDRAVLVDLKTTRELARFGRSVADMLYHGQLAFYRDGGVTTHRLDEMAQVYIVAVETAAPYDVGVFELDGFVLEAGRSLYRDCLHTLLSCRESGIWYGQAPSIVQIDLPPWAAGVREDGEESF